MVLLERENIYLQAFILGKSWYLPQLIFPSSQKLSCHALESMGNLDMGNLDMAQKRSGEPFRPS